MEILVVIITFIVGIIAGVITGLVPGIHVNTLSSLIISLSPFLAFLNPFPIIIFIISMATTHTFLNFIPSIFLGAPDSDTALSILPGHDLLNKGRGYIAVIYSLHGSLLGLIIILLFIPIFILILPQFYPYLEKAMFFILILASLVLLIGEKKSKKWALLIFFLSGILGITSNNLIENSLLPLLTGLFGSSSLLVSMMKNEKIPKQKTGGIKDLIRDSINETKTNFKKIKKVFLASILSAPLCCFLPSLGSSQAAVIGSSITKEIDKERFLILLGSINTIVAGLAFITFYSINKTRTGAVVAVEKIIGEITKTQLIYIITTIILSGLIASLLTIYLGRYIAKLVPRIKYRLLSFTTLLILIVIIIYFTQLTGIIIFIVSSLLGTFAILTGIRRAHLMGSLMVPTIIFYSPF